MTLKFYFSYFFVGIFLATFGQKNTTDIADAKKEAFMKFMTEFSCKPSDIEVLNSDSFYSYEVVYQIESNFGDPKIFFSRTFNLSQVKEDSSLVAIRFSTSKHDSMNSIFIGDKQKRIQTDLTKMLWGEPMKDSAFNLTSTPSIWATAIRANDIQFLSLEKEVDLVKSSQTQAGIPTIYWQENPKYNVLSYQNGKYLILDSILLFTYIGGQTDYGICQTLLLKRVGGKF